MKKLKTFAAIFGIISFLAGGIFATDFQSSENTNPVEITMKQCTMDVQCGAGKKCTNGVCTGGINPSIKGKCVTGSFGKKVCSNTGKSCNNDSECFR